MAKSMLPAKRSPQAEDEDEDHVPNDEVDEEDPPMPPSAKKKARLTRSRRSSSSSLNDDSDDLPMSELDTNEDMPDATMAPNQNKMIGQGNERPHLETKDAVVDKQTQQHNSTVVKVPNQIKTTRLRRVSCETSLQTPHKTTSYKNDDAEAMEMVPVPLMMMLSPATTTATYTKAARVSLDARPYQHDDDDDDVIQPDSSITSGTAAAESVADLFSNDNKVLEVSDSKAVVVLEEMSEETLERMIVHDGRVKLASAIVICLLALFAPIMFGENANAVTTTTTVPTTSLSNQHPVSDGMPAADVESSNLLLGPMNHVPIDHNDNPGRDTKGNDNVGMTEWQLDSSTTYQTAEMSNIDAFVGLEEIPDQKGTKVATTDAELPMAATIYRTMDDATHEVDVEDLKENLERQDNMIEPELNDPKEGEPPEEAATIVSSAMDTASHDEKSEDHNVSTLVDVSDSDNVETQGPEYQVAETEMNTGNENPASEGNDSIEWSTAKESLAISVDAVVGSTKAVRESVALSLVYPSSLVVNTGPSTFDRLNNSESLSGNCVGWRRTVRQIEAVLVYFRHTMDGIVIKKCLARFIKLMAALHTLNGQASYVMEREKGYFPQQEEEAYCSSTMDFFRPTVRDTETSTLEEEESGAVDFKPKHTPTHFPVWGRRPRTA